MSLLVAGSDFSVQEHAIQRSSDSGFPGLFRDTANVLH